MPNSKLIPSIPTFIFSNQEHTYHLSDDSEQYLIDRIEGLISNAESALHALNRHKSGFMKCDTTVIKHVKLGLYLCNRSTETTLNYINNEDVDGLQNAISNYGSELSYNDKEELRNLVLSMSPHELLEKLRQ